MVGAIFSGITEAVTAFIGTLNSGIGSIVSLFYDSSSTNPGLTVLGTLTVIVVGVSLVYWLFRLIMGMARLRG